MNKKIIISIVIFSFSLIVFFFKNNYYEHRILKLETKKYKIEKSYIKYISPIRFSRRKLVSVGVELSNNDKKYSFVFKGKNRDSFFNKGLNNMIGKSLTFVLYRKDPFSSNKKFNCVKYFNYNNGEYSQELMKFKEETCSELVEGSF